ncbi:MULTISPECIES: thiolase family protein [Syntrophothermus]|uniref:acetyl-CoA C-acetyltransferase n=1 Tax=Syntrophothermus lipocalidus (strain DSM 12680 / TGB-C1) TaxID=643648 RepID=D7CKX6_SYNLT|nr:MULTISPECIES: thiolase family protein [Syntrophothermus]ADI01361.1 thiolase [Syntrophothermus lipocalidus DSM 12680]NSW82946.1 thiolase family protein [Syntrophothermus sp.]
MPYTKAFIPYGGYYSTPFVRWNGSLKGENPVVLGAATARRWFVEKKIDPTVLDFLYYGQTVTSPLTFFGHVYAAAVILDRVKDIPAMGLNQVCTTSVTSLALAANDVELGMHEAVFCLSSDRTSSHAIVLTPNPKTGGVDIENIVLDNFDRDPSPGAGLKMYQTAEAVAKEVGITREECDEVALLRYEQYNDALANDRAFQKRYMFPVEIKAGKSVKLIEEDEGITSTSKEALAKLKPMEPGGVLTFGSQTHPADGNCGIIVTTQEKAKELSSDPNITVQILSYAVVRVAPGRMAGAPAPALAAALKNAGLSVSDLSQVKTHNPFIVNDINTGRQLGIDQKMINNYGSSMVYGHPQAPTAGRAIIELIEALAVQGGGYGAFTGCAAGDIAASMVIKVS